MDQEDALKRLADCRDRIDELDLRLLDLLNARTRIVEQIGAIKEEFQLPIYEPKREDQVYHNILSNNHGPLTSEAVHRIYERIIDEMRQLQRDRANNQKETGA